VGTLTEITNVFRITWHKSRANAVPDTVRIEGRITEAALDEVRRSVHALLDPARPARVDVSGVKFLDASAVAWLRGLIRRDVPVTGCSEFVAELLKETKP
jgi:ABC-type transporter Mla MlaB component